MIKTKIRQPVAERLFTVFSYIMMTVFMIICIYPFYYILIYSISDPVKANFGVFLLPVGLDFTSYIRILTRPDIPGAFIISILRTVSATVLTVLASSMFAYLMTQKHILFKKFIYRFVIITMYLHAGLIPWYVTMRAYGLGNNFLLYILPGAVNAFFIILVKTYIEQLPSSIEESASIDGAGFFTIFFKIIFPLAKPIVATVAVFTAVGAWNSWMDNFLLVRDPNLQTLQMVLYYYLREADSVARSLERQATAAGGLGGGAISPTSIRMAITVITVVPILMVYPFLQRYFIKGIMLGAVKG